MKRFEKVWKNVLEKVLESTRESGPLFHFSFNQKWRPVRNSIHSSSWTKEEVGRLSNGEWDGFTVLAISSKMYPGVGSSSLEVALARMGSCITVLTAPTSLFFTVSPIKSNDEDIFNLLWSDKYKRLKIRSKKSQKKKELQQWLFTPLFSLLSPLAFWIVILKLAFSDAGRLLSWSRLYKNPPLQAHQSLTPRPPKTPPPTRRNIREFSPLVPKCKRETLTSKMSSLGGSLIVVECGESSTALFFCDVLVFLETCFKPSSPPTLGGSLLPPLAKEGVDLRLEKNVVRKVL